jgi:hypothetical protein
VELVYQLFIKCQAPKINFPTTTTRFTAATNIANAIQPIISIKAVSRSLFIVDNSLPENSWLSSLNPHIPTIHKSIVDGILALNSPTILWYPPTHPQRHNAPKRFLLGRKSKGVTSPLTIDQHLWFPTLGFHHGQQSTPPGPKVKPHLTFRTFSHFFLEVLAGHDRLAPQ